MNLQYSKSVLSACGNLNKLHLQVNVHCITMKVDIKYNRSPMPVISSTEKDLVGVDEKGNRLLFLSSEADFEEFITFKKSFLKR